MTNHVHLLVTPISSMALSALFQSIGRHYVPYINKTLKRRSGLWEGRHKGNIIEADTHFLSFICIILCVEPWLIIQPTIVG